MQKITPKEHAEVIERCLEAYLRAGTMELSLDQLGAEMGATKRMLVHYFGNRQEIETRVLTLLEARLSAQCSEEMLPTGLPLQVAVIAFWECLTLPERRGELRLILDLYRRAWTGSPRAQDFYAKHQGIWAELLGRYTEERDMVGDLLQLLQGAAMAFAITADPEPGRLALERLAFS